MTLDEIKQAYKQTLRAEAPEGSKGAGLGFLTMARDASAPLEYNFQPIDTDPDRRCSSSSPRSDVSRKSLCHGKPVYRRSPPSSPEVSFDFERHILSLKGESYPENAAVFYGEAIARLRKYLAACDGVSVTVNVALTYFNSSSTKMLFSIFDALNDAAERRQPRRTALVPRRGRRHHPRVRPGTARRLPRDCVPRRSDHRQLNPPAAIMSEPDLFESENSVLAHAKAMFCDVDAGEESYRHTLGQLISCYERLMRETRRLIRRSDREELEMNRLNHRLQELARNSNTAPRTTSLTGALNRGAVIDRATAALARGRPVDDGARHRPFQAAQRCLRAPRGRPGDLRRDGLPQEHRGRRGRHRARGRRGVHRAAARRAARRRAGAGRGHARCHRHASLPSPVDCPVTASFGVSWSAQGRTFDTPMAAPTRRSTTPSAAAATA